VAYWPGSKQQGLIRPRNDSAGANSQNGGMQPKSCLTDTFIDCDLTSLKSIQVAAKRFLSASDRLDILVCNAGIMAVDPGTTKEGIEIQFGTNHLGHASLIKLLLPLMLQTAQSPDSDVRIINLSSIAYQQAP